jgi:dihydrofolate reductase
MRPLRYSINVTLDGCCDHAAGIVEEEMHRHAERGVERADALILGRVTYQLMEDGWRSPSPDMPGWMASFAPTITATPKYVVSSTLESVDWNAELLQGDLETAVRELKEQPGGELATGGLTLPLALAELGLIDEYELVVHPRIAGHGPYLFAGLSQYVDLELVDRNEFSSGAVVLKYVPR